MIIYFIANTIISYSTPSSSLSLFVFTDWLIRWRFAAGGGLSWAHLHHHHYHHHHPHSHPHHHNRHPHHHDLQLVVDFYENIRALPTVTDQELNFHMQQLRYSREKKDSKTKQNKITFSFQMFYVSLLILLQQDIRRAAMFTFRSASFEVGSVAKII